MDNGEELVKSGGRFVPDAEGLIRYSICFMARCSDESNWKVEKIIVTPLRVVFDTNAFTPGNFDILEQSPLRRLCKSGRIIPIYGHIFLEETFRAYGVENKRQDLIERWLPFIAGTVDRFCDDFIGIWHKELVQGLGSKANIFIARRDQDALLAQIPSIPLDGSWRAWHASVDARGVEDTKRAAQRETSKAIRQEVADWRKAVNYRPKKHGISRLDQYLDSEVEHAGREFLPALVKCKNHREVAIRWAGDKLQYPYFTTFVINMLYIVHHAMTKPSDKIDLNAQADLDLMTHLLHADALVSNETGFLRQGFDDLWKPRGKVIFSSQQFVDFIRKL